MEPELCRLQDAVGRVETCPGSRCPFWDDEACMFRAVGPDVFERPDVAQHLLELRTALQEEGPGSAGPARRLFYLLEREKPRP
jgi:hypothetical protein